MINPLFWIISAISFLELNCLSDIVNSNKKTISPAILFRMHFLHLYKNSFIDTNMIYRNGLSMRAWVRLFTIAISQQQQIQKKNWIRIIGSCLNLRIRFFCFCSLPHRYVVSPVANIRIHNCVITVQRLPFDSSKNSIWIRATSLQFACQTVQIIR